jgi:hypothetical protein
MLRGPDGENCCVSRSIQQAALLNNFLVRQRILPYKRPLEEVDEADDNSYAICIRSFRTLSKRGRVLHLSSSSFPHRSPQRCRSTTTPSFNPAEETPVRQSYQAMEQINVGEAATVPEHAERSERKLASKILKWSALHRSNGLKQAFSNHRGP